MLRSWRRLGLLKNEAEPCDFLHISVPSRFQNQDELRLGATFFPCPLGHAAGAPGRVQKLVQRLVQGLPPRTPLIGVPGRWPGRPGVFALAERRRALAMGRAQIPATDREVLHCMPGSYAIDGSRGIRNYLLIAKATIDALKAFGGMRELACPQCGHFSRLTIIELQSAQDTPSAISRPETRGRNDHSRCTRQSPCSSES